MPRNNVVCFQFRVVTPRIFHGGAFELDASFDHEWEDHMKACELCRGALIKLLADTIVKVDKLLNSKIVTLK
jgi:hypothetical protein